MSPSDIVSINDMSLLVNIICQFDVKHIMAYPIKQTYIKTGMAFWCDTCDHVSLSLQIYSYIYLLVYFICSFLWLLDMRGSKSLKITKG